MAPPAFDGHDPEDLKLVYRVLHQHLMDHTDLMDSAFFLALQSHLQSLARKAGVDLADHAQWDAWLGQAGIPCEERMKDRKILQ